ncbi:uncharacterized protein LOC121253319 [Juglans microcarpa x Juglans regia]|uniref:uncharacterized protein LOC121253319 n=1 Tax=Juglans microcarpa x Juglans regia TaxID=2249226 RepID=UPI001B7EDB02|nr:uncharacterized protein LOC121253319 [Juglans microcarpa x Juglans regia]
MSITLTAKNKIGFVDGSILKPTASSSQFSSWIRCNNMVLSWLLNSLSKEIAASVIYEDSAMAMWCDLKYRFSQANGPRIFQLQKAIAFLTQDNLTVSAYFTQIKGLWDELLNYRPLPSCSCGALRSLSDLQQQDYVMCFLMGLNNRYSHIRGQILLIDPLPSVNKFLSLILQEERQRDIGSFMIPSIPFAALSSSRIGKSSVGNNASIRKDRPLYSYCGLQGHTVGKCFKLHGYPPGYRVKARSSTPYANQAVSNDSNLSLPLSHTQCQQLLALLNPESFAPTH